MDNKESFLTLGTIVTLKDVKHKMMIIGYCVAPSVKEKKIKDYIGCMYPEGMLKLDQTYAFDHSEIDKILFEGYTSLEDQIFRESLKKFVIDNVDSNGNLKDTAENIIYNNIGG